MRITNINALLAVAEDNLKEITSIYPSGCDGERWVEALVPLLQQGQFRPEIVLEISPWLKPGHVQCLCEAIVSGQVSAQINLWYSLKPKEQALFHVVLNSMASQKWAAHTSLDITLDCNDSMIAAIQALTNLVQSTRLPEGFGLKLAYYRLCSKPDNSIERAFAELMSSLTHAPEGFRFHLYGEFITEGVALALSAWLQSGFAPSRLSMGIEGMFLTDKGCQAIANAMKEYCHTAKAFKLTLRPIHSFDKCTGEYELIPVYREARIKPKLHLVSRDILSLIEQLERMRGAVDDVKHLHIMIDDPGGTKLAMLFKAKLPEGVKFRFSGCYPEHIAGPMKEGLLPQACTLSFTVGWMDRFQDFFQDFINAIETGSLPQGMTMIFSRQWLTLEQYQSLVRAIDEGMPPQGLRLEFPGDACGFWELQPNVDAVQHALKRNEARYQLAAEHRLVMLQAVRQGIMSEDVVEQMAPFPGNPQNPNSGYRFFRENTLNTVPMDLRNCLKRKEIPNESESNSASEFKKNRLQ